MAEVFISYRRTDRAFVAPIAAGLQELGIEVWYDSEISAGESFGAVIRARLKEAKAVLVCWSPEAATSQWVDAEADYARGKGIYLPIFVTRCELMPPFNGIHTQDLSHWQRARDDPAWIKLVARLANMIGREGVAAAANALASGGEAAKYEFARRYPDEPLARKIWAEAEARLRAEFANRFGEARAKLEERLRAETPAFDAWLADERRGAAKGPKPDPLALVEAKAGAEKALLERVENLAKALAEAKAHEGELELAKAEVERLTRALAGARTTAPARGAGTWALSAMVAVLALALVGLLVRGASAPSSQAVAQLHSDLDAAKRAEAEADASATKLNNELSESQAQVQTATADAARLRAAADDDAKKLSDATAALAAANDRVAKLQSDLIASQKPAPVAPSSAKWAECVALAPLASRTPGALSAAEECGLKPKDAFRECADCPTMVVVPAGSFTMGSPPNEIGRSNDEGPQRDVHIVKPFAVGAYAVTFQEWDACVSDGGCGRYVPNDKDWGRGRRPVINVSWDDAQAYVAWLSKKTGKAYRLLSESEWEYSARAGATTPFWQGATISPDQANYDGTKNYDGGPTGVYRQQTVPVGSFAPNGFGLYDMNGNVWQWVADCYRNAYRATDGDLAPSDGSEWKSIGICTHRVRRGGSWGNYPENIRSAVRQSLGPEVRGQLFGFRVGRALTP